MLLLDEEATCDDAAAAGGRREREGCIALGSGTLGWWCVCAADRRRMQSSRIPDRSFIAGWSLDSMLMAKNILSNSLNVFNITY
jgi:hypothetical protein